MQKEHIKNDSHLSLFEAVLQNKGIWGIIKKGPPYIYRKYIRELIPVSEYVKFNEIPVDIEVKLSDKYLPEEWIPRHISHFGSNYKDSNYESAIAKDLRQKVKHGDKVVVVGAGWGVTTVIAARQVGQEGFVEVFEGAKTMVEKARKTVHINEVGNRVRVNHSVVEKEISLYDDSQGANVVQSEELPACDVLELDCEGAEKYILSNLKLEPRIIIVETHGVFGSPTNEVVQLLSEMGYYIDNIEVADDGWRESCLEKDIMVVCASLQK